MTSLYKMFRSNSPDYDELRIKLNKALEKEREQKAEERLTVIFLNISMIVFLRNE